MERDGTGMEEAPRRQKNKGRNRKMASLVVLLLVAAAAGGAYWWFFKRHRVTTDNAYVAADSARISSRVPGSVLEVLVENDQPVRAGDKLLLLDPRDFQAAVDELKGALAKIVADINAARVSVSLAGTQTGANLKGAIASLDEARELRREKEHRIEELAKRRLSREADLELAQREFKRFDGLYKKGAVPEQRRDEAETALLKAQAEIKAIDAESAALNASLDALDQETKRVRANLEAAHGDLEQVELKHYELKSLQGEKKEAEARLAAAALNLSYCTITAPISGYIAQKSVQKGDRIQVGQALMAVVPLREAYVEANFKETQLEDVRIGQPAHIRADIYPGYNYTGKVVGIRAGTGAAFSLLPPENATGNWVKVVQRVPVKIRLDRPAPPDRPLRLGLSLEVTVFTRDTSGKSLIPPAKKP
jgi:membrane fusion protein (multidrug efflux system)